MSNLRLVPRLQIIDASSGPKPDNYRVSPISSESTPVPEFQAAWKIPEDPRYNLPSTPYTVGSPSKTPIESLPSPDLKTDPDIQSLLKDWSGRGSHVDFSHDEDIPLQQGRFLGHG